MSVATKAIQECINHALGSDLLVLESVLIAVEAAEREALRAKAERFGFQLAEAATKMRTTV